MGTQPEQQRAVTSHDPHCLLLMAPVREEAQVSVCPEVNFIISWHAGRVHRIGPTPPHASPAFFFFFFSGCFSRLWPWNHHMPHPAGDVLLRSHLLTTARCCWGHGGRPGAGDIVLAVLHQQHTPYRPAHEAALKSE